jgi:hypothetical protein
MPEVYEGGAPPAEQGGENVLTRQLGPLKTWQWGLAIGGAFMLYRFLTTGSLFGGGSSSTSALVPSSDGSTNGDIKSGGVIYQNITKTITKGYKLVMVVRGRTPIYDSKGRFTGHYITSTTRDIVGTYKIGGKIFYKLANGWYILASKYTLIKEVPTTTTVSETPPVPAPTPTIQIMAPTTSSISNPTLQAPGLNPNAPISVDNSKQITPIILRAPSYTRN